MMTAKEARNQTLNNNTKVKKQVQFALDKIEVKTRTSDEFFIILDDKFCKNHSYDRDHSTHILETLGYKIEFMNQFAEISW